MLDNYEDLISVAEFAKILGIKKRQAYNIIHSEKFRIFSPNGTKLRIYKSDVIEYIESNTKNVDDFSKKK